MNSKHFSDAELGCRGRNCCGGSNLCTQGLVDALEQLRAVAGLPIVINSAYRCQAHNAGTPNSAKNSQHQEGTAADIRIKGLSAAMMYVMAMKVPAFANGGIGVAPKQGYVHVDVRPGKARWCYDSAGKTCAWDKELDSAPSAQVVS